MSTNIFSKLASSEFWHTYIEYSYEQLVKFTTTFLPNVILAIVILIAGILLAKLTRYIIQKFLYYFFKVLLVGKIQAETKKIVTKFNNLLGLFIYWVLLIYFLFLSIKTLNITWVNYWLTEAASFAPKIAGIFVVLIISYVLSLIAKEAMLTSYGHDENTAIKKYIELVKFAVFATVALWGVELLSIDITIVTNIILITLFGIIIAIAIGFGLGVKLHVTNLICANNLRKNIKIGEALSINDKTGTVVDITNTHFIVETEKGIIFIPAKIFSNEIFTKNL